MNHSLAATLRRLPFVTRDRLILQSLALLVTLPFGDTLRAQTLPADFALQSVIGEPFAGPPVGFAFLPDGRILIIEKDSGNVRLAAAGANTSTVIATIPGLRVLGERGLLGIAVDPDWPARPYLYFHGTYADSTIHITMYSASGDLSNSGSTHLVLGSPYVLLRDIRDLYEEHNGGTLRFGPDGHLYVSVGDESIGCDAQDVNSFAGKILRLDVSRMPGAGSGPPPKADITPADNPFSGPTANARLVYAYGLRNPFRFGIDPWNNDLYIGDVGQQAWEEVDVAVHAGYPGNNYGWPALEGFVPPTCCGGCALFPPFTDPIYVYPNPPDPAAASVIGGPLYHRVPGAPISSKNFPYEYDGNLFFADFYAGWIRRLVRSGNVWSIPAPVPGQPDPTNWATNIPFIGDLQTGPDGGLYFLTFIDSNLPRGLHRIVDLRTTDAGPVSAAAAVRSIPNPGCTATGLAIHYPLEGLGGVRVRIYDMRGRLVRALRPATPGVALWDGRDDRGIPMGAGTYVVRLEAGRREPAQGKITLLD